MAEKLNLDKFKNLKRQKGSEFFEKWRLIVNQYPELLLERGKWFKYLSQTSLNYFDVEKVLKTARELPKDYSQIGYVFNQIRNNKKPKKYITDLFGNKVEVK